MGTYEGVTTYPACGNEPFEHLGVTWYPLVQGKFGPMSDDLRGRADEVLAVEREASTVFRVHGLFRVVPPGPGDAIRTLVVWADGVARWVSDSGDLDVLMIDDPITHNWVCRGRLQEAPIEHPPDGHWGPWWTSVELRTLQHTQ